MSGELRKAWMEVVEIAKSIDTERFAFTSDVVRFAQALERYVSLLPDKGIKHAAANFRGQILLYAELPQKIMEDPEFARWFIQQVKVGAE